MAKKLIDLPDDLMIQIKIHAAKNRLTANNVIKMALESYIQKMDARKDVPNEPVVRYSKQDEVMAKTVHRRPDVISESNNDSF